MDRSPQLSSLLEQEASFSSAFSHPPVDRNCPDYSAWPSRLYSLVRAVPFHSGSQWSGCLNILGLTWPTLRSYWVGTRSAQDSHQGKKDGSTQQRLPDSGLTPNTLQPLHRFLIYHPQSVVFSHDSATTLFSVSANLVQPISRCSFSLSNCS